MGGESTADFSEATSMKLTLDPPGFAGAVGSVPLSVRIRERLMSAGHRFHANDNIAAYLRDGELDLLQAEVEERLQAVLRALVIDVEQDHNSQETARRVAKMFVREVFAGRYVEAPEVTAFPNAERLNELMVVGPLRVRSACSHHLCPVMGRAWVGVMPRQDSQLIGLSKYARLIDWVMSRPQIQEEAIKQIADLLEDRMEPDGLAVVLEAEHYCMHWRGTKDDE
jgi:GTP cyclohydrolase I